MSEVFLEFNKRKYASVEEREAENIANGWSHEAATEDGLCPLCINQCQVEPGDDPAEYCSECAYKLADFYKLKFTAANERAEKAERERDEWKADYNRAKIRSNEWQSKFAAAQKEIDGLREAATNVREVLRQLVELANTNRACRELLRAVGNKLNEALTPKPEAKG